MFNIVLIVEENSYEKFDDLSCNFLNSSLFKKVENILQTIVEKILYYDKCIIYFDIKGMEDYKKCLLENMLYKLNENKMILYKNKENNNIQYVMNEIGHIYNGICTYLFMNKLNKDDFIPKIINSIEHTLNHGIYIKSSNMIAFHKEEINELLLEKTFYTQYKDLINKNGYYEVSIISFNYHHTWIKKMFFELKYISLSQDENNINYLMNLLYYKYVNMYAKGLLV